MHPHGSPRLFYTCASQFLEMQLQRHVTDIVRAFSNLAGLAFMMCSSSDGPTWRGGYIIAGVVLSRSGRASVSQSVTIAPDTKRPRQRRRRCQRAAPGLCGGCARRAGRRGLLGQHARVVEREVQGAQPPEVAESGGRRAIGDGTRHVRVPTRLPAWFNGAAVVGQQIPGGADLGGLPRVEVEGHRASRVVAPEGVAFERSSGWMASGCRSCGAHRVSTSATEVRVGHRIARGSLIAWAQPHLPQCL